MSVLLARAVRTVDPSCGAALSSRCSQSTDGKERGMAGKSDALKERYELFSQGDLERALDLWSDDFVWELERIGPSRIGAA